VVFDYGEVISRRSTAFPWLAARLGVDEQAFRDAYRRERDAYVLGSSDLAYWQAVGERLGREVDDGLARELTGADVRGWLVVDHAAVELVTAVNAAGVNLALLSNLPRSLAREVERQSWTSAFTHMLFSCDIGAAKPDAASWRALLGRLGAAPESCLMVDDRQYNVDGVRAARLRAERWSGAQAAEAMLHTLGVLNGRRAQR
jgi:putative hydrolase of the HAD superfamily